MKTRNYFFILIIGSLFSLVLLAQDRSLEFKLRWMNNEDTSAYFDSTAHPETVFVIESFTNGCHDCQENVPYLHSVAEGYANESRVIVLDVGMDCNEAKIKLWIKKFNPNHPVLMDCNGESLLSALGVTTNPTTVVLDLKHEINWKNKGKLDAAKVANLRQAVDGILSSD